MKLVGLIGGAVWQYGTHNFQVVSGGSERYRLEIWHVGKVVQTVDLHDLDTVIRYIEDYVAGR